MASDRAKFDACILVHVDAAYNLARHLVRGEADARDAVQEALMRAWKYFGSFRGHGPQDGLPWLLQIVRHSAWSGLANEPQHLPEDFAVADDNAPDPASELVERADAEMLRRAVDGLPAIYREVIVLRELEGLSYKEICTVTGTTMGTVMSRLSRARGQLLQTLAGSMREGGGA